MSKQKENELPISADIAIPTAAAVAIPTPAVVVTTAAMRRDTLRDLLMRHKNELSQALPKHITADRLIRVSITAMNTNPALLNCTTSSLIGCILQAAQLGLMPDGAVGEGYLIPFKNSRKNGQLECQFIVGYRGLITLAYRSGQIISIQARAVYENDKFSYSFGLNEDLVHIPANGGRGNLTHVYSVIRMKNGGVVFDVMTKDDVEDIRRMSKNPNGTTWAQHYDEMAIKTVIRRISKRTPLSPELIQAVQLEERVEILGESQESSMLLFESPDRQLREAATETINEAAEEKITTSDTTQAIKNSMNARGQNATQTTIEMIDAKEGKETAK